MKPYVLIITIHADPAMSPGYGEWGGTHTYMRELLDCMDDYGFDCVLVTRRSMEELPAREQYRSHCMIYRLENGPVAPIPKTDLIFYHQENLKKIQEIITDHGGPPTVIHSVYWNSGRLGMALSKRHHVPLVHSVISNSRGRVARGAKEPMPERAEYEQEIYSYAKWILCVSEDEKNDLVQYYQIPAEKLIVAGQYIHSCFLLPARDHNGFPRLNSTISTQVQHSIADRYYQTVSADASELFWSYKAFTYFGRVAQDKGVNHILLAWHSLYQKYQSKCPPLWIIGGSLPEIVQMRKSVRDELGELDELEREGKLVWWGCLDPVGASTLLLKTLTLITNSLYEPGGRVVTEAMSEGVPVIASPNGFARDLIRDWENGFLVGHGDERGLTARMEHFLRQPFLSDALGRNAKESAYSVIQSWDFWGRHLQAYGEKATALGPTPEKAAEKNCRPKRSVQLYPFGTIPLHPELLKTFFVQQTQQALRGEPKTLLVDSRSELYRIQGEKGNYIIKRPVSCLEISPLFVPVGRDRYVHTAGDRYRLEKAAYQSARSGILLGTDDFHQLFLLRATEPLQMDRENLPTISAFLVRQTVPLPQDIPERFRTILQHSRLDALEGLEKLLDQLCAEFPQFYFAPSGIFLPYVGWRVAPHILQYNADRIDSVDLERFQTICDAFRFKTVFPSTETLREINADTAVQHIAWMDGRLELIDREHRTIGTPENQVAAFLFSLFLQNFGFSRDWGGAFEKETPEGCDRGELLVALSYRLFYDAVMHTVLRDDAVEPYLTALEGLMTK